MQSPHRHACVGSLCRFQDTAERVHAESLKTGRCASVKQHCGNGKRRRRASNLPANKFQNQYNSKCSWIQAADLMPLSVWTVAIFAIEKIFKTGCSKRGFLSDQIEGLFRRDANRQRRRGNVNDLWIFSKRLLKIAFPWPMQWGDFFRGTPLKTQNSVGSNRGSYRWA